jgi:hypothetical protein
VVEKEVHRVKEWQRESGVRLEKSEREIPVCTSYHLI